MLTGQNRALDLSIDGWEPPCGCLESNSGPLEEQTVHLTSEPSLRIYVSVCQSVCIHVCAFPHRGQQGALDCLELPDVSAGI